ncbi:MAG: hypothetical protein WA154_06700, partial [Moraxellaceae bacterium]
MKNQRSENTLIRDEPNFLQIFKKIIALNSLHAFLHTNAFENLKNMGIKMKMLKMVLCIVCVSLVGCAEIGLKPHRANIRST